MLEKWKKWTRISLVFAPFSMAIPSPNNAVAKVAAAQQRVASVIRITILAMI